MFSEMKPKLVDNTASFHILVGRMASDANWEWARGYELGVLQAQHAPLQANMQGSDFWKSFLLLDINALKKKYGKQLRSDMVLELQANQVAQALSELGLTLKRLFTSHKARMDVECESATSKPPTRKRAKKSTV
jgi:hypothetical protein